MTEKLRPKLIKSNAVRGPFFQKNELDEKNSDKNMLKDYVAQPMTTIKTVVQPLSESGTFEISCKCFAAAAVDTAPDKDDFNRRILCTWKVERSYKDLDNCLQSIKELNGSIKEFSLLHKEDIAKAQELIDQLQSMKNLSVVIQDFLTENFCDFSSNDCRSKNSSFKEENFVAKNIFVSALVVSSGVVVACIVGSVSFMFREGVLPSLLGFMLGTVYLMIHLLSYLRTVIQVALLLTVILATFHRLLGFIVSLYIRNLLGWSKENRKFDINIDWIALRIGWDKNQVLLSGIEWKNPPPFKSTPCFVSIKEVSLTLSNQFLYRALCQLYTADESIVIDEVVIDGVNVYIEKTDKKEEGLNIWAAMGAKSLEDEKKYSGNLMSLLSSAGNMTVGALSSTATVGINAVTAGADLGYKAVSATANAGLSAVNATAAAGSAAVTATAAVGSAAVTATADVGKIALSTTKDIGSSIGSTFYSTTNFFGITKKDKADGISAVPAPVLSTPPKVIESNDQDKDDEDENPADSPWRDVADAPGFIEEDVADVFRKKEAAEKKEITLEINRVLLMNINLHAQDFLNAHHTEVDDAPSIVIKIMSMFREDMTRLPKEKGVGFIRNLISVKAKKGENSDDGRIGISPAKAGGRVINALITSLFATNHVTMLRIITMATASQTLSLITDTASTTVHGVVGAVQGVGSVVSSAASAAGAVGKSASNAVIGNKST